MRHPASRAICAGATILLVLGAATAGAEETGWLAAGGVLAAADANAAPTGGPAPAPAPAPAGSGNRVCEKWLARPDETFVPLHNFEGYSGGVITPMAYLIDQDHEGLFGLPSVSYTFICTSDKPTDNAWSFAATMPFLNRFEIGYSLTRTDIGELYNVARSVQANVHRDHVLMHTFSLRGNIIRDEQYCPYNPAVTAGVHFKMNEGIHHIDEGAFDTLERMGMSRRCGTDFTLVASKRIPDLLLDRPLFVSAGIRFTQAAHIGMMGFRSEHTCLFETNVFYKPLDWLTLGYEFRQKRQMIHNDQFSDELRILREEENWHLFTLAFQVTKACQVTALLGGLGSVGFQVKWDF